MTGPEHFTMAEELLHVARHPSISGEAEASALASAQVHATLALAAAQAAPSVPPGPCPVRSPEFHIGDRTLPREFCDLLAGHAGLHVAGTSVWEVGVE